MTFAGAADNGTDNVYSVSIATFSSDVVSPATTTSYKSCGIATDMQARGSLTLYNSLSTAGCSLAVAQTYV